MSLVHDGLLLDSILKTQEEAKNRLEATYGTLLYKAADLFLDNFREPLLMHAKVHPYKNEYSVRIDDLEATNPRGVLMLRETGDFFSLLEEYKAVFGRDSYDFCGFTFSSLRVEPLRLADSARYIIVKWGEVRE